MSTLLLIITIIFLLIGIVGSLLPVIPGNILIGLAIVLYGWSDGFVHIAVWQTVLLVIFAIAAGTSDIWLPLLGAKTGGASTKSLIFGLVGALIGFILGSVIPVVGNLLGALVGYLLGVFLPEYLETRDVQKAFKAVVGGVAGFGISTILQFVASITLTVIFLIIVF